MKAVEPFPMQYTAYFVSDKYLGVCKSCIVKFENTYVPDYHTHVTGKVINYMS